MINKVIFPMVLRTLEEMFQGEHPLATGAVLGFIVGIALGYSI